jgi:hypothetical protein
MERLTEEERSALLERVMQDSWKTGDAPSEIVEAFALLSAKVSIRVIEEYLDIYSQQLPLL